LKIELPERSVSLIDSPEGNYVPKELFDIVAEVILWAQSVRDKSRHGEHSRDQSIAAPGEDLSGRYIKDSI